MRLRTQQQKDQILKEWSTNPEADLRMLKDRLNNLNVRVNMLKK